MKLSSSLLIVLLIVSGSFNIPYAQSISSVKNEGLSYIILPEGNNGIASRYPGDKGITGDSAVFFADDFESYLQPLEIEQRWDALYQRHLVGLTKDSAVVYAGKQSLEFTLPQQTAELSDGIDKILSKGQDVLFLRYYSRFHSPFDVIGSSHNGSSISANYMDKGRATPGIPANGTNKFLVNLENWRGDAETPSPGYLNLYVYHPEQRSEYGDHFFPDGIVSPYTSKPFDFGPHFIPRPPIITPLDQWFCYEYMVKANTPGKRDGRIAVWVDGKLVADFMNLRLRDIESLKIDRFGLSFHIKSNPKGEARKWFDNVVVASSYIGPVVPLKE